MGANRCAGHGLMRALGHRLSKSDNHALAQGCLLESATLAKRVNDNVHAAELSQGTAI